MQTTTRPWFSDRMMVRRIPRAAIQDCSAPGQDATESVAHWVRQLRFEAPVDYTREYLAGTGAWDAAELADHDANLQRLFWVICGNLRDEPREQIYLDR